MPVHVVEEWLAEKWDFFVAAWREKIKPPLVALQAQVASLLEAPRKRQPPQGEAEEEQNPI